MKFIILCFPRTGSTLLVSALGAVGGVRQGMEIFNPVLEGDAPYVTWRKRVLAELFGEQASFLDAHGYLDGERFELTRLAERFFADFDGTKIMYDQLALESGVWNYLRAMPDLRVIVLRRNIVEAAVSFRIAMETNVWHVAAADAGPSPPRLVFEPGYISWFYDHFCARESRVTALFPRQNVLEIDYRDLVDAWPETIGAAQRWIGIEPVAVDPPFRRGAPGAASELIANYDEVRAHYASHPVLARHFASAAPQGRRS
ncbi:MAG: Stf0 family sulfotransferase [Hyphomicrobiaceae bacterium]